MGDYTKIVGLLLVGLILWILVDKREKDIAVLLTIAVCCAGAGAAVYYLQPVVELLRQLSGAGQLDDGLLEHLLKAVGVGFLSETVGMICSDAGNSSMGSITRFLGCAAIVYISVPLFQTLLTVIQDILGVL